MHRASCGDSMTPKEKRAWEIIHSYLKRPSLKELALNFVDKNPELFNIPVFIRRKQLWKKEK